MSYLMSNNITITIAVIAALGLIATVFAVPQAAEAAPKPRVVICHQPEFLGDDPTTPEIELPEPGKTKTLPLPAATAHLRNHEGDTPGPCPPVAP